MRAGMDHTATVIPKAKAKSVKSKFETLFFEVDYHALKMYVLAFPFYDF